MSVRKKDKTPLEVEAENLVKDDDVFVSDDEEEEPPLKKERRAGETLLDFLERQTRDQIRNTLGNRMKQVP